MRRFILFIKEECSFCEEAANKLASLNHSYEEINLSDKPKSLSMIKNLYGWDTVPIILEYVSKEKQEFVGGYSDLEKYLEEDKND